MPDKKKKSKIHAAILQRLEAYGDSMMGKSDSLKRKNTKMPASTPQTDIIPKPDITLSHNEIDSHDVVSARSRRKRKKKKAAMEAKTELENMSDKPDNVTAKTGKERHIETIKQQLGLAEFKTSHNREKKSEKKGRSDGRARKEPEVVVFTAHKKKHQEPKVSQSRSSQNPEFSMKNARFEVQKFGIKGFHGDEKDAAMTALLLQLGARPPKNKYTNYKDLQVTRKVQIQQEREKKELDRKLGFKVPSSDGTKKRPKDRNDVGQIDGQVGRYKRGVQFVKKDDIIGIKKSKIK